MVSLSPDTWGCCYSPPNLDLLFSPTLLWAINPARDEIWWYKLGKIRLGREGSRRATGHHGNGNWWSQSWAPSPSLLTRLTPAGQHGATQLRGLEMEPFAQWEHFQCSLGTLTLTKIFIKVFVWILARYRVTLFFQVSSCLKLSLEFMNCWVVVP